jgi:hemolysin activation/secretion protein
VKYIFACCLLWIIGAQSAWSKDENKIPVSQIEKLHTNLLIGSFKGWDIYFDNYIETDAAGFSLYQLAPKIITKLNKGRLIKKDPDMDLVNFTNFLVRIFSEMPIERRQSLPQDQLTELFNLAYNVNLSKWDMDDSELSVEESLASLTTIQDQLNQVSRSIENFYQSEISCPASVSWQRVKDKPLLSMKLVVIEDYDESIDDDFLGCYNRIDSRENRTDKLWVNNISIVHSSDNSMRRFNRKVDALLKRELREKTNYNPMGIKGFSEGVLLSLADNVSKLYYQSGGGHLNHLQNRALLNQLSDLYRTRGLSFSHLGEIADTLKTFYRQNGFVMSTVYVPEQDFFSSNGNIKLSAQSGVLGKVKLNSANGVPYSDDVVEDIFKSYIGRGVTTDISETYFKLGQLPGLTVKSGFFEVGDNPGETNLVVDVDEEWGKLSLISDNYGSELTGKNRAIASVDWNNPTGFGDNLSLGYLYSFNPDNSQLGFLNYLFPIILPSTYVGFSFEQNNYSALKYFGGSIPVAVEGDTQNQGLSLKQVLVANKDLNLNVEFLASQKSALISTKFISSKNTTEETRDESSKMVSLGLHLDFLVSSIKTAVLLDVQAISGRVDDADELSVNEEFTKYKASINTSTLISFNHLLKSKLSYFMEGGFSSETLPSYDQFAIGGPDRVKAFSSSVFLGDSGIYNSLELTTDVFDVLFSGKLAAVHELDVGLFYESSSARLNAYDDALAVNAQVSGYGAVLRYNWRRNLVLDASVSFIDKQYSEDDYQFVDEGENNKSLINVRYTF